MPTDSGARGRLVRRPHSASTRSRPPDVSHERRHWNAGRRVAGLDEVGRGAWAGPVTVGAVVLPVERRLHGVRDSKLLTPIDRERIAARIAACGAHIGIGHASNEEIDAGGLSEALKLAACRALDDLPEPPDVVLVDGPWDFAADYGTDNETLVRGDMRSRSIAAASVVAKVTRDQLLVSASETYPAYGFASNKGYPSPHHRAALAKFGPCTLHRQSWEPIAALSRPRLF